LKFEQEVTSLQYLQIVGFKKFTFLSFRSQIEDFNSSMFLSFRWAMFYYVFFLSANYFKFCLSSLISYDYPYPSPSSLSLLKSICAFLKCFLSALFVSSSPIHIDTSELTRKEPIDNVLTFQDCLNVNFKWNKHLFHFRKIMEKSWKT
jgi:hypothetical protein